MMDSRGTLAVAVVGSNADRRHETISVMRDALIRGSSEAGAPISVTIADGGESADEALVAGCHLVVGVDQIASPWIDVVVDTPSTPATARPATATLIIVDRVIPWASRWQAGWRASRAQVAQLVDHDPLWHEAAARLIARLGEATTHHDVVRIDHIGSTSVPRLAAKDLIDIQVTIGPAANSVAVAQAAVAAGFVHVAGEWFGKDAAGTEHPEQVCVDADPKRPVNINIRKVDNPVAREVVLFRDWLRANSGPRSEYETMKKGLVGRQIDDYGDRKEPFISAALTQAEEWSATSKWRFLSINQQQD